jgi:hypothetical protein
MKPVSSMRWSADTRLQPTDSIDFPKTFDILVNPAAENSRRWIVAFEQLPDHATRDLLKQGARPKDQMDAALLRQVLAELKR